MQQSNGEQESALAVAQRQLQRQLQRLPWRQMVKALAAVTTAGMFLVLVMGTLVTNSGSATGCGQSWPLCKGQFIPQFAVSTFIEFSHRAVTAAETVLVLALTAGVLVFWRSRREIKILAPLMVIFLFAQAALGALAVMYPESPEILALHFGVSLISFASILLTTLFIFEYDGWDRLRDRPVKPRFARMVWGLLAYSYIVVYIGAYVQHKKVQLACHQWPACNNGNVLPTNAAEDIVFVHRFAAFLLVVGIVWLVFRAYQQRAARPDLFWGSVAALVTVLMQALEGAFVVFSQLDIFSTLMHGAFVALLFGSLCYLALHTLRRPKEARQPLVAPTVPAALPGVPTRVSEGADVVASEVGS